MTPAGWLRGTIEQAGARLVAGYPGAVLPPSVVSILVANLTPLVGVLFFGWDVGLLLIVYWIENGIVGLITARQVVLAAGPPTKREARSISYGMGARAHRLGRAAFFLVHYGAFWATHGLFVLFLGAFARVGRNVVPLDELVFLPPDTVPWLAVTVAAFAASHLNEHRTEYIGGGGYRLVSPEEQSFAPYPRMLVLHGSLIIGGWLSVIIGFVGHAVILVLGKTWLDLALHRRELARSAARAGAGQLDTGAAVVDTGRLDAFAAALDRLRVEDLFALAARPADPDLRVAARGEAARLAEQAGRSVELAATHERIERYVLALFNASTLQPGWMEANWGRPGSAADRAHLAASLRDAVTALSVEDLVPSWIVDELLGPWATLLEDDTVSR